ncbi:GNAT family N-acetyltransferase [Dyadobacter luticola]|uniref:GNAT family N-acetyltransferase n=1 Tax=Dyadobacter luticola TaxID=1979387 RepID=A0A5R9L4T4_9BACT|nr:GNAT family N-acetyltransferase [Dyadobacter luticola]TLV03428.1 GNAT family N-acetyltransferase [Dyadobacter luticola]
MNFEIVAFSDEYIDDLRELFLQSRRDTFTWADPLTFQPEDFDQSVAGESILVALIENNPVGFISWWPPDNFIHNLFMASDFHDQGIGKALLSHCLSQISRPAKLKCLTANLNAMEFYRRQGWTLENVGMSGEGEFGVWVLEE